MADDRPVGVEWHARTVGRYSVLSVWEHSVTKIRPVLGLHRHGDGPFEECMYLSFGEGWGTSVVRDNLSVIFFAAEFSRGSRLF